MICADGVYPLRKAIAAPLVEAWEDDYTTVSVLDRELVRDAVQQDATHAEVEFVARRRDATGEGAHVDMALFDTQVAAMALGQGDLPAAATFAQASEALALTLEDDAAMRGFIAKALERL